MRPWEWCGTKQKSTLQDFFRLKITVLTAPEFHDEYISLGSQRETRAGAPGENGSLWQRGLQGGDGCCQASHDNACQGHQSACLALAIPRTILKRLFLAISWIDEQALCSVCWLPVKKTMVCWTRNQDHKAALAVRGPSKSSSWCRSRTCHSSNSRGLYPRLG